MIGDGSEPVPDGFVSCTAHEIRDDSDHLSVRAKDRGTIAGESLTGTEYPNVDLDPTH